MWKCLNKWWELSLRLTSVLKFNMFIKLIPLNIILFNAHIFLIGNFCQTFLNSTNTKPFIHKLDWKEQRREIRDIQKQLLIKNYFQSFSLEKRTKIITFCRREHERSKKTEAVKRVVFDGDYGTFDIYYGYRTFILIFK